MAYLFMIFSYVIYDIDVFENDIFCVYKFQNYIFLKDIYFNISIFSGQLVRGRPFFNPLVSTS